MGIRVVSRSIWDLVVSVKSHRDWYGSKQSSDCYTLYECWFFCLPQLCIVKLAYRIVVNKFPSETWRWVGVNLLYIMTCDVRHYILLQIFEELQATAMELLSLSVAPFCKLCLQVQMKWWIFLCVACFLCIIASGKHHGTFQSHLHFAWKISC